MPKFEREFMKRYDELVRKNNGNVHKNSTNLGSLVKYIGAFSAASTVFLYFLGYIYYQTYLNVWSINSGLFPLPYKDTLIYGFFPIFYGISNALIMAKSISLVKFILVFFTLTLYIFLIIKLSNLIDGKLSKKFKEIGSGKSTPSKLEKVKSLIRDFIISAWIPLIVIFGIPVAIYTTSVIIALPVKLADEAGRQAALQEKIQYDSGCSDVKKCTTIKDSDGAVITGYMIRESASNIAIYDTNQHTLVVKRTSDIVEQKTNFTEKDGKATPLKDDIKNSLKSK